MQKQGIACMISHEPVSQFVPVNLKGTDTVKFNIPTRTSNGKEIHTSPNESYLIADSEYVNMSFTVKVTPSLSQTNQQKWATSWEILF